MAGSGDGGSQHSPGDQPYHWQIASPSELQPGMKGRKHLIGQVLPPGGASRYCRNMLQWGQPLSC